MDHDHEAPCIHLAVDDDDQGDCLQGSRSFPVDCRVLPSGAIGCACYVPSVQLSDWEAHRVIRRWRAMRAHYTQRSA